MKNIDYLTIREFADENTDFFVNSRVQKIQQPTRRDFIFSLRNSSESRKFYININPQFYHIAFVTEESLKRRGITIPNQPPMFCMLLRKYLQGARISDVFVPENERIIEFHFEVTDECATLRSLSLTIELMGKHSNVILYDRENSVIIGCAHNVGAEKSKYRELHGGLKYVYPPKVNSIPEFSIPFFKPCEIDEYFSKIQGDINLKTEKSKLKEIINLKLKKTKNTISNIEKLLKKRDNTEKYKLFGELLTANIYSKKNYLKEIEVYDYINFRNIKIELDETKTISENAQRYFKLYNKSKSTKEKSQNILRELNIEKEYFENVLYSIETASDIEELEDIKQELGMSENKPTKQDKTKIEKINIEEFDVYIGKNNKQNDYIISKLAKDNDYWFHTRLCAGSHVLLKFNGIEPNEKILFECCKLARKYSSAQEPSKVGVIYTKAKYLRKPPAAPLGYVTYRNEKEILV